MIYSYNDIHKALGLMSQREIVGAFREIAEKIESIGAFCPEHGYRDFEAGNYISRLKEYMGKRRTIQNIARSRILNSFWQSVEYKVIPTTDELPPYMGSIQRMHIQFPHDIIWRHGIDYEWSASSQPGWYYRDSPFIVTACMKCSRTLYSKDVVQAIESRKLSFAVQVKQQQEFGYKYILKMMEVL